jgi:hypothetical protein
MYLKYPSAVSLTIELSPTDAEVGFDWLAAFAPDACVLSSPVEPTVFEIQDDQIT